QEEAGLRAGAQALLAKIPARIGHHVSLLRGRVRCRRGAGLFSTLFARRRGEEAQRLGARMPTRRKALGAAAGVAPLPLPPRRAQSSVLVNDIHSQLNPTRVDRIVAVDSEATLHAALAAARAEGKPVCLAGGRHAMGGQQFAEDAVLLDMRPMRRIVGLDNEQG